MSNIIFFDTETTGVIPKGVNDPCRQTAAYPRIVQLSWKIGDKEGDYIIRPEGFAIPDEAAKIHGITTEKALADGIPYKDAFLKFFADVQTADTLCAHNAAFDKSVIIAEYVRMSNAARATAFANYLASKTIFDTMLATVDYVGARYRDGRPGKFPRLEELYAKLFNGESFPAHNSMEDVRALAKCYFECKKRLIF